MRFIGYGISVLVLLAGLQTAFAAGTGFAAGSYQVSDPAMYCDRPMHSSEDEDPVVTTAVHPIWQVASQHLDLGYIEDDIPTEYLLPIISLQGDDNGHPVSASTETLGVRLDNGWSLGLTYETIDTSLKLGSAVEGSSIGPVYEGPMFVATLKFR